MCTPARVLRVSGRTVSAPGIVGDFELARSECVPAVVVPDERGGSAGEPGPSQAFFGGNALPAERVQRLLEHRGPRRGAVNDEAGQAVEQEVRGARGSDRTQRGERQRCATSRAPDPCASRPANKAAVIASR